MAIIQIEIKDEILFKAIEKFYPGEVFSVDEAVSLYKKIILDNILDSAESVVRQELESGIDSQIDAVKEGWKND